MSRSMASGSQSMESASVADLKSALRARGISFNSALEKRELLELVEKSESIISSGACALDQYDCDNELPDQPMTPQDEEFDLDEVGGIESEGYAIERSSRCTDGRGLLRLSAVFMLIGILLVMMVTAGKNLVAMPSSKEAPLHADASVSSDPVFVPAAPPMQPPAKPHPLPTSPPGPPNAPPMPPSMPPPRLVTVAELHQRRAWLEAAAALRNRLKAGDASREPIDPEYKLTHRPFCTDHWCGSNCNGCHTCSSSGARLLYLHTEKTGGSSIECAVQSTLVQDGLWVSLGHTKSSDVQKCAAACPALQNFIVLSVREPYSYWTSVYEYAKQGIATSVHPCGSGDCWALQSFDGFLKWVTDDRYNHQITQTQRIQRACGIPCRYDSLLRTENLTRDWASLLKGLKLPAITLPRLNAVNAPSAVRASQMTRHQLDTINRIDAWVFSEFGYRML